MKPDQLNTFLASAEDLNFTQAARRLHLSQSAVSQQIRELEEDLGLTLFERRGRGLLLTPAGERLRMLARPILRELQEARAEMETYQGAAQGVLRVGASNTLGIYLLPYALGRFSQLYPGVRTSLSVSDSDGVLGSLHDAELDLALVEEEPAPGRSFGWQKQPFLRDELVLIAAPDHPWARRGRIDLTQLARGTFIFRQRGSGIRQLIADRLSEAGLEPERLATRFELGNTEGIKRAVMAGLGVGWVSRYATVMEQAAGALKEIPVENLAIARTLWLLRPAPERMLIHQARFCEMLLEDVWLPEAFRASAPDAPAPHDPAALA